MEICERLWAVPRMKILNCHVGDEKGAASILTVKMRSVLCRILRMVDGIEVSFSNLCTFTECLMVNLLVWAGSSLYHGLCPTFSVLGLSLNLRNGRNLISRLYMGPVWTGHSFFRHLNTSMCRCKIT